MEEKSTMDVYEYVKRLYEKKKKESTPSEQNKIQALEKFFYKRQCFFEVKSSVAYKILYYLGVPQDEINNIYCQLVSPKNYKKYAPSIRTILPDVYIDADSNKKRR